MNSYFFSNKPEMFIAIQPTTINCAPLKYLPRRVVCVIQFLRWIIFTNNVLIPITFYVKLGKSFTETHKTYGYNVETKLQSSQWLVNYVQDQKKLVKVLVTVFFLTTWE